MPTSKHTPKPHVLALLRKQTGLVRKELADISGCTPQAVQVVELGRGRLTEPMAYAVSAATGVDYSWLIANRADVPVRTRYKQPYDRAFFTEWRKQVNAQFNWDMLEFISTSLLGRYAALRKIFARATRQGEPAAVHAQHRLKDLVEQFARDLWQEPLPPNEQLKVLVDDVLTPGDIATIEHDLQTAREFFESRGITVPPPPTEQSMQAYRRGRCAVELPPQL